MTRFLGLAITLASAALGFMCADIIQHVSFGGYVFEGGLALAGAAFSVGVYMVARVQA